MNDTSISWNIILIWGLKYLKWTNPSLQKPVLLCMSFEYLFNNIFETRSDSEGNVD